jgi:outer membrane protein
MTKRGDGLGSDAMRAEWRFLGVTARSGAIGWPFLLALVALAGLPWRTPEAQPSAATRVGYVDMKRLLDNAPQVVAGRARLQKEFAPRDTALKAEDERLIQLKQKSERDGALMTKDDAEKLKREIEALDRSVRRMREDLRNELKTRSDQELDKSWQEINNAVVEYARAQGIDLVVPSPVVYANPRIDITDAVLERLRKDAAGKTP